MGVFRIRWGFRLHVLVLICCLGHIGDTLLAKENTLLLRLSHIPSSLSKKNAGSAQLSGLPAVDAVLQGYGVSQVSPIIDSGAAPGSGSDQDPALRWVRLAVNDGENIADLVAALGTTADVEVVQFNRTFHLDYIPQDPLHRSQWGLESSHAYEAWDIQRGSSQVLVAVIDTGLDYAHPDLVSNIWINAGEDLNGNGRVDSTDFNGFDDDHNGFVDDIRGWDFTDAPNYPDGGDYKDRDNDPMDELGHGTAVGGIIAAVADNGMGIAGAAHGCRLMGLRAFTANGNGEEDDVASAILYAIANGAAVINMSWGDVFVSRLLDDVIRYAARKNVVMVASSGNAATDRIHYPSGFTATISVGAIDRDNHQASFSNYGPTLDLVAPGVEILSTNLNARYDSTLNGTSFAAPFVSAAAALLLSQDFKLQPETIRGILTGSADDLGSKGWDRYFGSGKLNIARALRAPRYSVVRITQPWLDDGYSEGPIEIRGSAWSPTFEKYDLEYGVGENPDSWLALMPSRFTPVLDDILGQWQALPTQDSSLTVRLRVTNRDGSSEESSVRILLDRTAPRISSIELLPMLDGDHQSVLVQFRTDDLCESSVFYRTAGSMDAFQEMPTAYRTVEPRLSFSPRLSGTIELYVQARNAAGLVTRDDRQGAYYHVELSEPPIPTLRYTQGDWRLPHGHLLHQNPDMNGNGRPELIIGSLNENDQTLTQIYEWNGTEPQLVRSLERPLIPRSVGDSDGDGRLELLCGYGFSSYLYEASQDAAFVLQEIQSWIGNGERQYWASRLADLDGDRKAELIMRVVSSVDGKPQDQFEVWHRNNASLEKWFDLKNPTTGSNLTGVPHSEVGDFDGDGRQEILLGDSDGDLYIYEYQSGQMQPIWQATLPLQDTIEFTAAGDFDGDGKTDFIAGCHSDPNLNTEHYYDSRHWLYRIYKSTADNQYEPAAEWRFFGFESIKDYESGVSCGDIDGDGRDEIFVGVFPDGYMIEMQDNGAFIVSYYQQPVRSNGAIFADIDSDGIREFWVSDGREIHNFIPAEAQIGPARPVGLSGRPLDAGRTTLTWYPVPGADAYQVFRGSQEDQLAALTKVAEPFYTDSTVVSGQLYWYAVAAIDSESVQNTSPLSQRISLRPGARPFLLIAEAETERNVRLYFSEPMDQSVKDPMQYWLGEALGHPASCTIDASGQQVVLNLDKPLPATASYQVSAGPLFDQDGTPLDTLRNQLSFQFTFEPRAPYVISGNLVNSQTIELVFSEPMALWSLSDQENYLVSAGITIAAVRATETHPDRVQLQVSADKKFGALGVQYEIIVQNLYSATGVRVASGRGDRIQLIFHCADLANVFTYPNPYRYGLDGDAIHFANLTREAQVRIMTIEGKTIRVLNEDNGDGGLAWDARDEQGQPLPSGIYLFRVSYGGAVKLGKLAIVR